MVQNQVSRIRTEKEASVLPDEEQLRCQCWNGQGWCELPRKWLRRTVWGEVVCGTGTLREGLSIQKTGASGDSNLGITQSGSCHPSGGPSQLKFKSYRADLLRGPPPGPEAEVGR